MPDMIAVRIAVCPGAKSVCEAVSVIATDVIEGGLTIRGAAVELLP